MALLDIFKKKKKQEKAKEKKTVEKFALGEKKEAIEKEEKTSDVVKVEEKKSVAPVSAGKVHKKEFSQIAAKILKSPHVTEKAINLGQQNKYVFKVSPDANKVEVKKAIQEFYGVKVQDVNITNIPRKKIRVGGREGFRTGIKKAVVTLAEGEKIEAGI